MHLKLTNLLVLGSAILASVPLMAAQRFAKACGNVRLHDHNTLAARCRNKTGDYRPTVFNIDACFANDKGRLVRQDHGHYSWSCDGCTLDPSGPVLMSCYCVDGDDKWVTTSIRLSKSQNLIQDLFYSPLAPANAEAADDYLTNYNGYMCCGVGICSTLVKVDQFAILENGNDTAFDISKLELETAPVPLDVLLDVTTSMASATMSSLPSDIDGGGSVAPTTTTFVTHAAQG
ncbi:unnamed protein product [Parascedosporium putredinis]|uniref:Cyanovirin-N domain-containing protein n=1 Tax=Parascedosporium putredinis TaxID=1442378 RepID=A0A9P1M5Q8_9PEZI|nr:unnamed protein product [Parascedosporium putredinis]CAI7988329.1 unnamed protein product [Parascedosporium putredinis]